MGRFGREGQQGRRRAKGIFTWRRWALIPDSKERQELLLEKDIPTKEWQEWLVLSGW